MTLLRTALIWDINLTYQARVPKSEPTDNALRRHVSVTCVFSVTLDVGELCTGALRSGPLTLQPICKGARHLTGERRS